MKKKIVKKNAKLPSKPSALIRLALKDLRAVEAIPIGVVVNMGVCHSVQDKRCTVCLAGAVIHQRLGVGVTDESFFDHFPKHYSKLSALDYLRQGDLERAFTELDLLLPSGMPVFVDIPEYPLPSDMDEIGYGIQVEAFHKAMGKLADRLEKKGF